MDPKARRRIALSARLLGVGLIAGLAYAAFGRTAPPRGEVTPSEARMVVRPGEPSITAEFRVRNTGGRPLVLKRTMSSCACSVASVEPDVIPPGGEGVVTVKATPPASGERPVTVRIETNSVPEPELAFNLTLVGNAPVPFIAEGTKVVQFGSIGAKAPAEVLWFTAHEKEAEPP